MLRIPHRRARPGRAGSVLVVAALLAASCSPAPAPSATAASVPPVTATPALTATPAPAYADTLRIGWGCTTTLPFHPCNLPGYRSAVWPGTAPNSPIYPGSIVYSALYRYDATFAAVPDLADGPCFVPGSDGTVIRCRLVETTFHDGTPLTADDVAYSYRLRLAMGWPIPVREVRVVDPRTVDFALPSVDPLFLTEWMPAVPILPQHAVEAAYADWVASTKGLKAADLTKLADAIDTETGGDPPVCAPRLNAVAALLPKLGVRLYREDYLDDKEAFDPCQYLPVASGLIRQAATALGATGLEAVATAYGCFSTSWQPIGAGPYRLVSTDATRVHLEAWPGHHGGAAATRYVDFVPTGFDVADLVNGRVDIYQATVLDSNSAKSAASQGLRVATLPSSGYMALNFNVRPGHLFADVNLRKALQLCIDLPRDVEAATGGTGIQVHGPVPPGWWGYDPTLPEPPARDTAAARALIEGAGWHVGADGIYTKDGVPLAAQIVVRGVTGDRAHMADLIGLQARDCGMDIRSYATDLGKVYEMLDHYPHNIPDTKTPFDLYVGNMLTDFDPGYYLAPFFSSNISDATHPDASNFMGFSDPVVDRLAAQAKETYDQAERAGYYRVLQQELAAQVAAIFLWTTPSYDALRAAVTTVDGPLDLTTPNWAWQPERLVVGAAGQ